MEDGDVQNPPQFAESYTEAECISFREGIYEQRTVESYSQPPSFFGNYSPLLNNEV